MEGGDGGFDAAEGASGNWPERSVPGEARPDRRPSSSSGEAREGDRLALPRGAVRSRLYGCARPPAAADAVDGGVGDPQAHARPLRRGAMRALGREPVLPAVLRRGVLLSSASVRPLVADALAPAHGGGQARRADPGEPGRRDPHGSRQARGLPAGSHRHDRAGEGDYLPDGRQADASRPRAPGAPRPSQGRNPAPIVPAGRQDRADQAPALCPRQAVQADPRHHPQDRRPTGTRRRVRAAALACAPGQGSAPAPAWPEALLAACSRGRVHWQSKAHKPYEFGVKVSVATPLNRCRGGQFVAHVKALPGNPYDGHTLAAVLPDIESTIGAGLERIVTDAGYKGHNAPKHQRFKVYVAGQKRGLTAAIKRAFRRRSAVEPTIGHLKNEHRMGRNHLAGRAGDAANAVLAAVGYNFGLLLRWLALLLRIVLAVLAASSHSNRTIAAS